MGCGEVAWGGEEDVWPFRCWVVGVEGDCGLLVLLASVSLPTRLLRVDLPMYDLTRVSEHVMAYCVTSARGCCRLLVWLLLAVPRCSIAVAVGVLDVVDERVSRLRSMDEVVLSSKSRTRCARWYGRCDGECCDAVDGRVAIPVGDRVAQLSDVHD